MYTVDDRDVVVPLENIPQSDVGAPCPVVFADEYTVIVAYLMQETDAPHAADYAVIQFQHCEAHLFGLPNDEAFEGHPLAGRGLGPYGAFRIENSSWIRQLERMNSVHPRHEPERFSRYTHFVLSFHDSTFECVAQGYVVSVAVDPRQVLDREMERLWQAGSY